MLMNMKMDENINSSMDNDIPRKRYNDTDGFSGRDINNGDFEIDLPEGAKKGLKDATQEMQLNTDEMDKVQKSYMDSPAWEVLEKSMCRKCFWRRKETKSRGRAPGAHSHGGIGLCDKAAARSRSC